MKEPINKYLERIRKKSGYERKQIAEEIGISKNKITKYETGQNKVPTLNFLKIIEFYYTHTPRHKKIIKIEEIFNLTDPIWTKKTKKSPAKIVKTIKTSVK